MAEPRGIRRPSMPHTTRIESHGRKHLGRHSEASPGIPCAQAEPLRAPKQASEASFARVQHPSSCGRFRVPASESPCRVGWRDKKIRALQVERFDSSRDCSRDRWSVDSAEVFRGLSPTVTGSSRDSWQGFAGLFETPSMVPKPEGTRFV